MTRRYEIQWLNDGPRATGYVGWTSDGIGDDNLFSNRRVAEQLMAQLRRATCQRGERPAKMRVVEVDQVGQPDA